MKAWRTLCHSHPAMNFNPPHNPNFYQIATVWSPTHQQHLVSAVSLVAYYKDMAPFDACRLILANRDKVKKLILFSRFAPLCLLVRDIPEFVSKLLDPVLGVVARMDWHVSCRDRNGLFHVSYAI
jgi:hypothetical protein